MSADNFGDMSMRELFALEVDTQVQVLTDALLALEANPLAADQLDACMRAAHSLKGAARIVNLEVAVRVAHQMEDCFVSAQRGSLRLQHRQIDWLLRGVDLLKRIAHTPEQQQPGWTGATAQAQEIDDYLQALAQAVSLAQPADDIVTATPLPAPSAAIEERMLRLSADNLNQLLGLASESLVASRWVQPFSDAMHRLKKMQGETARQLERLDQLVAAGAASEQLRAAVDDAKSQHATARELLGGRLNDLDEFTQRSNSLSQRLYDEALSGRMRPFGDGVAAFPRMVRDLAKSLDKRIRLVITGQSVAVDRDILEKLDAPLTHLLRNALDHGIESEPERRAAGKPDQAEIRLEASHAAGMLQVAVCDDGRGIATERLREKIIERQLTNCDTAEKMSDAELLEFVFLPGFTLRDTVSELSGRGVGLDIVQHMVKQVRGSIRIESQPGIGTCFRLQLPLTMSVVRALVVEIGGEAYAFPLARLVRVVKLARSDIELLEGHQHFALDGQQVGLVAAHQVLQTGTPEFGDELMVVVVGDPAHPYGLAVDRLLCEQELVVQLLDARLGKVKDIAAGALMENGTPVLIVDVDDMIRSVDKLVAAGSLLQATPDAARTQIHNRKRVLVVDDSLTVRELERKLLGNRGYQVEVAIDGMDGWNAVRTGHFDLVITDVDMPRMDGIELVGHIKQSAQFKSLPVMIVSYKDREDDRRRGLDAGADYYLTKGSFHDQRLLEAVADLIGEATP